MNIETITINIININIFIIKTVKSTNSKIIKIVVIYYFNTIINRFYKLLYTYKYIYIYLYQLFLYILFNITFFILFYFIYLIF